VHGFSSRKSGAQLSEQQELYDLAGQALPGESAETSESRVWTSRFGREAVSLVDTQDDTL
jgi:hypothetical protein